jgi:hypothetical protein
LCPAPIKRGCYNVTSALPIPAIDIAIDLAEQRHATGFGIRKTKHLTRFSRRDAAHLAPRRGEMFEPQCGFRLSSASNIEKSIRLASPALTCDTRVQCSGAKAGCSSAFSQTICGRARIWREAGKFNQNEELKIGTAELM